MIERREFISICRQIGAMMEVGVDFLRITQALRAQTDNPRLLALYDGLDTDLKAGDSLSEAMSHAPDVFSPFAVSLVRQGEARGDIESAWNRIADFFRDEAKQDLEIGNDGTPLEPLGAASSLSARSKRGGGVSGLSVAPLRSGLALPSEAFERVSNAFRQLLLGAALLLGILALARALVEAQLLPARLGGLVQLGLAAVFLAGASAWMGAQARFSSAEEMCAFCGRPGAPDRILVPAPSRGAVICTACAQTIAQGAPPSEEQREREKREQNVALQSVANALPGTERAPLNDDTFELDEDDPLAPAPSPRRSAP